MGRNVSDTKLKYAGLIEAVSPGSLAAELGLRSGDEVLSINGHALRDVIDVQFYAAETERAYGRPLGIHFAHPTFDIDIRRCNNLCEFCFVLQTAPRMRRTLYIKDDDYRYSFLQGHYVTLTNLSDEDWARIEEQRLSPLYISVHATDLELRRDVLRNPNAPDVMAQLRWLGERGIELHTQIVVTPGLNDGPHLDRSIADLADVWPAVRSISVVPVGITRHHKYGYRPNTLDECRTVLDQVTVWQGKYLARWGVRFAYLTDEWYLVLDEPIPTGDEYDGLALQENGLGMVRAFLDEWTELKPELRPIREIKKLTLVTGTLFGPTLAKVASEFAELTGVDLEVVPVTNQRLGETITVAGLLMGQDIVDQLRDRALGDLVVLPRIAFDHPDDIALDDVAPEHISQALGRPLVLAECMEDLWEAVLPESANDEAYH
jgi:putative radical SAM enzyme (TIGR03279 family)